MRTYRAQAYNEKGLTFRFTFMAYNWNGVDAIAQNALTEIVNSNSLHIKYGPWKFRNIDVSPD